MTTLIFILPFLVVYSIVVIYAERKISAFMQDRLGPMEVGYYGMLQTVADLLKLLQKEEITPAKADRIIFRLAPILIFVAVFTGFSVLPLSPTWPGSSISTSLFFLLAFVSLDIIGILIAGWSSNNKYSALGTLRAVAQLISYEVPLGLAVLCVVIVSQTLDLQEISFQQSANSNDPSYLLGIKALGTTTTWGGIFTWNVFRMPLLLIAWVIFFIASLAESNRTPFDLPQAEAELVAGFQTEYSGFRWGIIMLAEYAMMLLTCFLGSILFFGGWNTPFPNIGSFFLADWTTGPVWGIFWIVAKTLFFVVVQIWVRWSLPRLRVDQLMNLSWKYLTPLSLILIILCGFWKLF
jgi:NADH-quinone oxidoreductase subunit H